MEKPRYLTVTALTKYIKKKFDVDSHMMDVFLKGEISNFTFHSRGHMYFTLKDEKARIQAVMFSSQNNSLKFTPEDGMNVLVRGEISVYEQAGQYQIYVKEMQPDGIGQLYLAYEEMKKKLELEGLFSKTYKKAIPKYPEHIGVITSPTGAAIRDILTTLHRRYPSVKVTVIPAIVQGDHAAKSVTEAITKANELEIFDVLIVGRGGGSIEDLWPFNEEVVARAIFKSNVPIISAVGHETDYTIADFVADLRAPTPTGAAELSVPNIHDVIEKIEQRKIRLIKSMKDRLEYHNTIVNNMKNSYAFKYPKKLYMDKEQEFDRLIDRFEKEKHRLIEKKEDRWIHVNERLKKVKFHKQINQKKDILNHIVYKMMQAMDKEKQQSDYRLRTTISKLNALSPLNVLERGYSFVYGEDKEIVKSINQAEKGKEITVQLKDGQLECQVLRITGE